MEGFQMQKFFEGLWIYERSYGLQKIQQSVEYVHKNDSSVCNFYVWVIREGPTYHKKSNDPQEGSVGSLSEVGLQQFVL